MLLPIFSISRSGNLTEPKFHELYDPLLTAVKAKSAVLIIGIVLTVIFIGFLVFATIKKRKLTNKDDTAPKSSQLGISLQEQHLLTEHYP